MAQTVNIPDNATGIAYGEKDYAELLQRLFNGAQSTEDILASLGTPWTSIGSGNVSSDDNLFILKNMTTDYFMYHVQFHGLLIDTTAGNGVFGIRTSVDNGATFSTGSTDYSRIRWSQTTTQANLDLGYGTASYIEIFENAATYDNVRDNAGTGEHLTLMLDVVEPMSSDLLTFFKWKAFVSDTSGNIAFSMGSGNRLSQEANDAFALYTDANTWEAGTYNMYGLARAT